MLSFDSESWPSSGLSVQYHTQSCPPVTNWSILVSRFFTSFTRPPQHAQSVGRRPLRSATMHPVCMSHTTSLPS